MARLAYRINAGERFDELRAESGGLFFSNGVEADRERLKFYAQHCQGHIELRNNEFNPELLRNVIPALEQKTNKPK